jgi:hypothetical protein
MIQDMIQRRNKNITPVKGVILKNDLMAGHVGQNWNTIYPSLIQMYRKVDRA